MQQGPSKSVQLLNDQSLHQRIGLDVVYQAIGSTADPKGVNIETLRGAEHSAIGL
jgi:hypothetical protein